MENVRMKNLRWLQIKIDKRAEIPKIPNILLTDFTGGKDKLQLTMQWFDSGWWRYKLNTMWKAMWECEWHNLVANFRTKQCKWRFLMAKFWIDLQQIINAYSKEIQIRFYKKYCKSEVEKYESILGKYLSQLVPQ